MNDDTVIRAVSAFIGQTYHRVLLRRFECGNTDCTYREALQIALSEVQGAMRYVEHLGFKESSSYLFLAIQEKFYKDMLGFGDPTLKTYFDTQKIGCDAENSLTKS